MSTATNALIHYPINHDPSRPFDPPPGLRELQLSEPVSQVQLWDGLPAWLITDHALGRQVLADPRTSSEVTRPHFPHPDAGMKTRFENSTTLMAMDEPAHGIMRKTVTPRFAVRRVEAMRPIVQKAVDELIDKLLAGPKPADLVSTLALPLPAALIAEILGVPAEDGEFFQVNTAVLASSAASSQEVLAAMNALTTYFGDLIEERRNDPLDDLVSDLAAKHVATASLTVAQAADLMMALLLGGYETTANMIAMSTALLLQHPDQLALLQKAGGPEVRRRGGRGAPSIPVNRSLGPPTYRRRGHDGRGQVRQGGRPTHRGGRDRQS